MPAAAVDAEEDDGADDDADDDDDDKGVLNPTALAPARWATLVRRPSICLDASAAFFRMSSFVDDMRSAASIPTNAPCSLLRFELM